MTGRGLKPTLGAAETAIATLEQRGRRTIYRPTADELAQLGLGDKELAAAARNSATAPGDNIVLHPKTPALAMRELVQLAQPFTAAEARQALGTTRRTLIPC